MTRQADKLKLMARLGKLPPGKQLVRVEVDVEVKHSDFYYTLIDDADIDPKTSLDDVCLNAIAHQKPYDTEHSSTGFNRVEVVDITGIEYDSTDQQQVMSVCGKIDQDADIVDKSQEWERYLGIRPTVS